MSLLIRRAARSSLAEIERGEGELDRIVWIQLIEEQLPVIVCLIVLNKLMRKSAIAEVDAILDTLESRGDANPLLDEFIAKQMFARGHRAEAIAFAKEAAVRWDRDYLFELVEILKEIKAEKEGVF